MDLVGDSGRTPPKNVKGKVQTVLGCVMPEMLGRTLTHEHLMHDVKPEVFECTVDSPLKRDGFYTIDHLAFIRQHPYSNRFNITFNDDLAKYSVREEMLLFKRCGGGTIVDNSSIGLRDAEQPYFLKRLSEESEVNIVAGTGFYVESSQHDSTLRYEQERLMQVMASDISYGIGGTTVKCGVIGELGCSWPATPFENNVLKAAAEIQSMYRCPVIIHPGRHKKSPGNIMRIFLEAGGCADQTVMSHLDRTLQDCNDILEFAGLGCYCEFDLFGLEVSHYQLNEDIDMLSDAQRICLIKDLISEGFEDKVLVSHDIHTKHRLMAFGGHGYSHILLNVIPKMMKRGISADTVNKILVKNPAKWLIFK